ncbi:hypothetical protein [Nocardioides sp. AE5]|uniref:DUF7639 domain-containing protein n=1 Tax=Nocardioides sp. AE5 TaxID=2962573 RepID=UPI00288217E1|nr:hypothetical protein [Nocardioides sp. AE5]MDT0203378.1 hypothetical protein [Nocardioides sp. AE5]
MGTWRHTYRIEGEDRIDGRSHPIFINNGGYYFLSTLVVFADGRLACPEPFDLDGLRERLASGQLTTEVPPGARVSLTGLAHWTVAEQTSHVTAEGLVLEVLDQIEALAGRPTSSQRCLQAAEDFLAHPDEAHRDALRAAYLAIPAHERRYVLGDMDLKDRPLRVLITAPGGEIDGRPVTPKDYAQATAYFAERKQWAAARESTPE